jgi:tetratricopeptide (TPR) repeat protein
MLSRMKSSLGLAFAGILFATVSLAVVPAIWAQEPDQDDTALQVIAAINGGMAAFKNGQYADAAASFSIATRLAPGSALAHLYLGTAYAAEAAHNPMTPENKQIALSALEEFDAVLKLRPDNLSAMKQAASLDRSIQRYDDALGLDKKVVEIDPGDVEAIYSIGYLDWQKANMVANRILAEDGLTDDGLGNVKLLHVPCMKLRAENSALVNDGIANLKRAIELKPDNADAMQYLQLMYRRRADLACGERSALNADLKLADEWKQKAAAARKPAGAESR